MGIWIRSQDKKVLAKISSVVIQDYMPMYRIRGHSGTELYILGEYRTREEALEVLDKISEHITLLEYISKADYNSDYCAMLLKEKTYQMPEAKERKDK